MKNSMFILVLFITHFTSNAQLFNGDVIALKSDNGKWFSRCNNCQNATYPNTVTVQVSGDAASLPAYSRFKVEQMSNGKIALKSDIGKYLARCNNCVSGGPIDILTDHVDNPNVAYAQFQPERLANGKYVFKSDNGKYLARCNNCSPGAAYPDIVAIHESDKNAAWAQWSVTVLERSVHDGDVISLKSDSGKWFARCDNCQKAVYPNTVMAHVSGDARSLPAYARFKVVGMPNGKVALKADSGKYVARCNNCVTGGPADILTIHVDDPNVAYAQFQPERLANGKFVFKSDNGKYLARCNNCSPGASYPDIVAIHESNKNAAWAQWSVTFDQQMKNLRLNDAAKPVKLGTGSFK